MVWISSMNRMMLPALDLTQQALDPLLELAAELGAGHEAGQIQQKDFLILQAHRDIAPGDALRDASAMAVLPTPASPMRQGLFFWRRLKIWMVR